MFVNLTPKKLKLSTAETIQILRKHDSNLSIKQCQDFIQKSINVTKKLEHYKYQHDILYKIFDCDVVESDELKAELEYEAQKQQDLKAAEAWRETLSDEHKKHLITLIQQYIPTAS